MIRQAGIETPPQGMAERIMHRIELANLKQSPDYHPVINTRGWMLIGGSAVAVFLLIVLAGSKGKSNGNSLINADPFFRFIHKLHLSFHFDLQVPKSLLFGLAGLLLLVGLDFLFTSLKWKRSTLKEES
jgi:hypothetical protein